MTNGTTSNQVPKQPAHRRAWVLMQLRIRGRSFTSLARDLDVTPQAIGATLLVPAYRIECAIARAIDLEVHELFPERYDSSGRRLHYVRGEKVNTGGKRRNVYSRRVA